MESHVCTVDWWIERALAFSLATHERAVYCAEPDPKLGRGRGYRTGTCIDYPPVSDATRLLLLPEVEKSKRTTAMATQDTYNGSGGTGDSGRSRSTMTISSVMADIKEKFKNDEEDQGTTLSAVARGAWIPRDGVGVPRYRFTAWIPRDPDWLFVCMLCCAWRWILWIRFG